MSDINNSKKNVVFLYFLAVVSDKKKKNCHKDTKAQIINYETHQDLLLSVLVPLWQK